MTGLLRDKPRLAAVGLVAVLLTVTGFTLWSAQSTADSARDSAQASQLSDDFTTASYAIATEESFEQKYLLEPSSQTLNRFKQATADLTAALANVQRDGSDADRQQVEKVLAAHGLYLSATSRMFAAVDRGDSAGALRIDDLEVDPRFTAIQNLINTAAAQRDSAATRSLTRLNDLEEFTSIATPIVFVVGLLLILAFASVLRRVQRTLDDERKQTIYDSEHDALTGLPNRTLLAERLNQALIDEPESVALQALLLIDLDRFKEVNDTLGHAYGDQLLVQIGPRLTDALPPDALVARLGGDEFAVLLPRVSSIDEANGVAQRLRTALAEPFTVEQIDLDVEASIGIAVSGEHGTDAATLLQRADVAMYVAKARGSGVASYDPTTDSHSPQRLALLGELRRGLERGELTLHYQPKVALRSGVIVGVESLIRWQHPTRGMIEPDEFIPLAEHTGLIHQLTAFVLDAACAQARQWHDAGRHIPVAVNISARSLLDEQLPDQIRNLLKQHDLSAALLELEVTESAIMLTPARLLLTELAGLGITLSIDDFGAGYTSLAQLRDLPINELKVDSSFVRTMDSDPANALIVRSIVDLGHNLGFVVVAEGVETQSTMNTLDSFGCDIAQGFHLAPPLPADDFLQWYQHETISPEATNTTPGHARRRPETARPTEPPRE